MAEKYLGEDRRQIPRTPATEIAWKRFGGRTYTRAVQVTASTQKDILVKASPNRVLMLLINNSASDVYVNFVTDVSSDFGIIVAANGGRLTMKIEDEGEGVIQELHAVAGSDDLKMTLIETLIQE